MTITQLAYWIFGFAFVLVLIISCQDGTSDDRSDSMKGAELYHSYCEICHGENGNGPMADQLTVPVPDLTKIAARRNGEFPEEEIYKIIDGREIVKGHGTQEMPIWGPTFMEGEGLSKERQVREKIEELVSYLKMIQE